MITCVILAVPALYAVSACGTARARVALGWQRCEAAGRWHGERYHRAWPLAYPSYFWGATRENFAAVWDDCSAAGRRYPRGVNLRRAGRPAAPCGRSAQPTHPTRAGIRVQADAATGVTPRACVRGSRARGRTWRRGRRRAPPTCRPAWHHGCCPRDARTPAPAPRGTRCGAVAVAAAPARTGAGGAVSSVQILMAACCGGSRREAGPCRVGSAARGLRRVGTRGRRRVRLRVPPAGRGSLMGRSHEAVQSARSGCELVPRRRAAQRDACPWRRPIGTGPPGPARDRRADPSRVHACDPPIRGSTGPVARDQRRVPRGDFARPGTCSHRRRRSRQARTITRCTCPPGRSPRARVRVPASDPLRNFCGRLLPRSAAYLVPAHPDPRSRTQDPTPLSTRAAPGRQARGGPCGGRAPCPPVARIRRWAAHARPRARASSAAPRPGTPSARAE